MTTTITKELKTYFINNTIGYNLVALLINMPSLGVSSSPNNDQLLLRENLTMATAVAQEVADTDYKRHIVEFDSEDIVYSNGQATVNVTATFTPLTATNSIGPFTHVVWVRGANLVGANDANGNNRGDTTGTIWKVQSVLAAPTTFTYPVVFSPITDITIAV